MKNLAQQIQDLKTEKFADNSYMNRINIQELIDQL